MTMSTDQNNLIHKFEQKNCNIKWFIQIYIDNANKYYWLATFLASIVMSIEPLRKGLQLTWLFLRKCINTEPFHPDL